MIGSYIFYSVKKNRILMEQTSKDMFGSCVLKLLLKIVFENTKNIILVLFFFKLFSFFVFSALCVFRVFKKKITKYVLHTFQKEKRIKSHNFLVLVFS